MLMKRFFHSHLGYRGMTLFMFGLMFAIIAVAIIAVPNSTSPSLFPVEIRFAIWAVGAGAGIITAWRADWHKLGYALLVVGPVQRLIAYTWAWISEPSIGLALGSVLYGILTFAIFMFASWPEPLPLKDET